MTDIGPVDYSGMVKEFHLKFGHPVNSSPKLANDNTDRLRLELIYEEVQELADALAAGDKTEIADALGDILYVTFGAAHVYGIPINAVFAEIQRSNMSKLGEDGKPVYREDGKVLKGPNYSPPNIAEVLEKAENG